MQFRDSLSQYTQPHFGNQSGFGKQKSSATFEEPSKMHFIKIEDKNAKEELLEKDISIQIDTSQGLSTDLMWGKAKGFATGLITGVSLTSLISLALRKKR